MTEYLRGGDYAFNYYIEDSDGVAFNMANVLDVFIYIMINQVQVARYSLNTTAGYVDAVVGDVAHEVVVPVTTEQSIDWPLGKIVMRIEVVVDEDYFDPNGQNNPILVDVGMLK